MIISGKNRLTFRVLLVFGLLTIALLASSFASNAMSGLEASGKITSKEGAVLRSKATTKSSKVAVLKNGSVVEVRKMVFTHKKKHSAKYKWYYVNTGAGTGYIRSDLIKVARYGKASGKTTKKVAYRRGAGSKMSKKGTLKKNTAVSVVLEVRAKGSKSMWYKIKRGSHYYYVPASCVKISNKTSGVKKTEPGGTPGQPAEEPAITVKQSAEALKVVNGACSWASKHAADNRFHYGLKPNACHNGCYYCGTQVLTGGRAKKGINDYEFTYCCNPFVHAAFSHGGKEQAMLQVCQRGSSYWINDYPKSPLFANLGVPDMSLLKKGDVLCTHNHVMLYMGNGKIAEATGGDDNVPFSTKWNNSIRVCTLSASKYAKVLGAYRYVGNVIQ